MSDKMASRISSGLLAAVALSLFLQPATLAERDYIGGTRSAGYPIGTMSSSQYSGSLQNRYGTGMAAGPSWWYGGAGMGATTYTGSTAGWGRGGYGGMFGGLGGIYGMGGAYGGGMSNQVLYPTADGPQPTTTPTPSYGMEAMDNLATQHQVVHTDGPSMSFASEMPEMPKVSSYFNGFWRDMDMGASVSGSEAPAPVVASDDSRNYAGRGFAAPRVRSRLSPPVQFNSQVAVRSELRPMLQEAEQTFTQLKNSNKLGTFDIEPLETQMQDLRRRAKDVDNIQNSVEQKAEEGRLINAIRDFEYQLRQHVDTL